MSWSTASFKPFLAQKTRRICRNSSYSIKTCLDPIHFVSRSKITSVTCLKLVSICSNDTLCHTNWIRKTESHETCPRLLITRPDSVFIQLTTTWTYNPESGSACAKLENIFTATMNKRDTDNETERSYSTTRRLTNYLMLY